MFFFEKKNQKTFAHGVGAGWMPAWRPAGRCLLRFGLSGFGFAGVVWPLLTGPAFGADLQVTVTNLRNARGHVLVALCARADFLKPHCPWQGQAQAAVGSVQVTLRGVPPGRYALQAFHDENDNRKIDRNFFGMPTEGLAFSNDAPMHFGPPAFDAAAISVTGDARQSVTLRYY